MKNSKRFLCLVLAVLTLIGLMIPAYAAGDTSATWTKVSLSQITATDVVAITLTDDNGTTYAMTNKISSSSAPRGLEVSVSGNTMTSNAVDTIGWNITRQGSGFVIYVAGRTDAWLYSVKKNNGVRVGTGDYKYWAIDVNSENLCNLNTRRFIGCRVSKPDFRNYLVTTNARYAEQTMNFWVLGNVTGSGSHTCECTYVYDSTNSTHIITCEICGEVTKMPATDSKEFRLNSASLLINNKFGVVVSSTFPAGFTPAYAKVQLNGKEYKYTEFKYNSSNGRYTFDFSEVDPGCMGDTFTMTVYAKVGDKIVQSVNTVQYSLVKSIDAALKKNPSAAQKRLYSNLLAYGDAYQIAHGYKTDALASSLLSDAARVYYSPDDYTASGFVGISDSAYMQAIDGTASPICDIKSIGLVLTGTTMLRAAFAGSDVPAVTIKVTVDGETYSYAGSDLEYDESTKRYTLNFDKLAPTKHDDKVSFSIWSGNTQIGRTLEYSVYTYIYKNQSGAGINNDALRALYNFSEAMIAVYGD